MPHLNPDAPSEWRNFLKLRLRKGRRTTIIVYRLQDKDRIRYSPQEVAIMLLRKAALDLHCKVSELRLNAYWTTKT